MKARIDTKAKTIAIEESVSMEDLLKFAKFVGGDDWKAWKIETNVKFEIASSPIVIREYGNPWHGPYWYGTGNQPINCLVTNADGTSANQTIGAEHTQNSVTFMDFQNN